MTLTNKIQEKNNNLPLTDFDLGVLLERTRSVYSRMRELELAQYNITPEQAAILNTLQSKGGSVTNREISTTIIRQYHSVTSIVNRMLKIGLVRRYKNHNEKKFRISITKKGKSIYEKVPRHSIEMIFSDLTFEEKQQLASSLQKLLNKGREMLGMDHILPFLT